MTRWGGGVSGREGRTTGLKKKNPQNPFKKMKTELRTEGAC